MKRFRNVTSFFVLVGALCFALSFAGVSLAAANAGQPVHDTEAVHSPAGDGGAGAAVTAEHGAAESHTGSGHGSSLTKEKLKDLFWRVINFIALMIILVRFGAKPIAGGLADRQKRIREELEDLESKRNQAERSYREFEARLATVEKDIDSIVEKAVAQARIEKARIIEKAEQAADEIKRQAEFAIQNEISEARQTLKNDAADQAAVMAEALIVQNLTADDQVRIIEDYLDRVGAAQ
ncbi:MAG: hypothetical protein CR981_02930 [Proteobacteria bacterium]|nr:MAG: hypothetical protein CR981_02930 [Pseudomonadota bacterium]PIE65274.1 MAG: hypothetical protein CSA26_04185 [Desulfobacterales bacterium]